jgi:hypothetical protein
MKKAQVVMDKAAIGFSVVCAVHCVLAPIALTVLPVLSATPLVDEKFHQVMLFGILPTSIIALAMGCRRHKSWAVAVSGLVGLAVLTLTAIFGHILLGEFGEKVATLVGAVIIAYGHIQNHKLCCKNNCHI